MGFSSELSREEPCEWSYQLISSAISGRLKESEDGEFPSAKLPFAVENPKTNRPSELVEIQAFRLNKLRYIS